MPLISNIYLILLLPLLAAFSCLIIKNRSINYITTVSITAVTLIQLLKAYPNFLENNYIYSHFSDDTSSLILNYNFNIVGLVFASAILFQKLISFIFFKEQIDPKIKSNYASFHISTLVNIFAILLILTSSNFVNLFISIEIYLISLITSQSIISTKEQNKLLFKQIFVNNLSSTVFIIACFFIYLNFKSFDFNIIKQISANKIIDVYSFGLILLLLTISISLKFFQVWVNFNNTKISSPAQQYVAFENLFTKTIIGIYLALKFANIFYANSNILQSLHIDTYLIILISIASIYFALDSLLKKNLKTLLVYYCFHHINLILLAILINNQDSLQSVFYYLLSLTISAFSLYLIVVIIDNYVFSGNVNLRANKKRGALIFSNIISASLFLFSILPISFLFFANFYLIKSAFSSYLSFIVVPTILIISTSFFISAINVRSMLVRKILKEKIIKKILKKSHINLSFFNYNFYLITVISLILLNLLLLLNNQKLSQIFFSISQFILTKQV